MAGQLQLQLGELTALAREDPAGACIQAEQDDADTGDAHLQARLAALMIGAALAAVDDYEALVRARIAEPTPADAGDLETDRRRWLGIAIGKLETARCILSEAALEPDSGALLFALSREASRLAYMTVQDLIVHVSGITADSKLLASIAGVMVALWGHPSGDQDDQVLRRLARERLDTGGSDDPGSSGTIDRATTSR